MLGGTSAVNGMMYLRGSKPDFDALESATGPLWGWEKFLSTYRSIEDHALGASDLRGSGGPLGISMLDNPEQIHRDILAAGEASRGWSIVDDMNETDEERIGLTFGDDQARPAHHLLPGVPAPRRRQEPRHPHGEAGGAAALRRHPRDRRADGAGGGRSTSGRGRR